MTGKDIERWWPNASGLVTATLILIYFRDGYTKTDMKQIIAAVLTVSSIGAGFVATAKGILLSLNSRILRMLRSTNYYHLLIDYMIHSTRWCLLLSAISLALLFFNFNGCSTTCSVMFPAYMGLVVFTGSSIYRSFHLFGLLLQASAKEN